MAHKDAKTAAAVALATGKNVRESAKAAGIGERTLHRWRADPAFCRQVADLKTEMFGQTMGRLTDLSVQAANVLGELLKANGDKTRLQAAQAIITLGVRMKEFVEMSER